MSSDKIEGLASGDSSESARNQTQTPGVVTDQPPPVPPHLSTTHQPPPLPPRPRSRPPSPLPSQHPVVPLPPFSPLNPLPSLLTVPALHTDPFVTPNHSPVRNNSVISCPPSCSVPTLQTDHFFDSQPFSSQLCDQLSPIL